MKRLLLASAFILFMFLLVGCQNAAEYSHEGEQPRTLSALRTPYVGNASDVSRIIQVLPIPSEGWMQKFMSIDSYRIPYSLTVYYEPSDSYAAATMQTQVKPTAAFEANSLLLFVLIDNLDEVTFAVRYTPSPDHSFEDEYEYFWTVSRDEIAELFGINNWSDLIDNNVLVEDLLEMALGI